MFRRFPSEFRSRFCPHYSPDIDKHWERPHKGSDMNFGAKCTHKTELNKKNGSNQLKVGSFSSLSLSLSGWWWVALLQMNYHWQNEIRTRYSAPLRGNREGWAINFCRRNFLSSSQQLQMYENGIGPQGLRQAGDLSCRPQCIATDPKLLLLIPTRWQRTVHMSPCISTYSPPLPGMRATSIQKGKSSTRQNIPG